MKRLFSLLFATLALATGFLNPSLTHAAVIGQSCCPTGFTFSSGRCVNSLAVQGCDKAAEPNSFICNITWDFGPLGGVQKICDFGNGGARIAIRTACNSFAADKLNANEMATGICQGVWDSLLTSANIVTAGGAGALLATLGARDAFINSCYNVVQPGLIGAGVTSTATSPFVCDPTLICNQAGTCAKGLPPAIAPGARCVSTALGCFDFTGKTTIQVILNWSIGIAGGIAFIMILAASLQITTARGDAKRVQAGKELLFSALAGIFMIVLAIVLLNFLGLNVLGLQQFGFV